MVEQLLEKHKVTLATAGWVIAVIIVPLTIWFASRFASISYQIEDAHAKIAVVEKQEKKLSERFNTVETRITDKLDIIHKDVGEIKGELRRISR